MVVTAAVVVVLGWAVVVGFKITDDDSFLQLWDQVFVGTKAPRLLSRKQLDANSVNVT